MDEDFERRRELRRQKREEMRMEAERMVYRRNDEDEEEAARERRRRARQERLRNKESEEVPNPPESVELNNSHSVTVTEAVSSSVVSSGWCGEGDDEEQALLERLAKREERRQRRMKEALDRQKEQEPFSYGVEEHPTTQRSLEEYPHSSKEQEKEEAKEEYEETVPDEEEEQKEEVMEEKPQTSYLREQMEDGDGSKRSKQHNGGVYEEGKPRKVERTPSHSSLRSPEAPPAVEEVEGEGARLEAERKLEELKRRRDETESEEFERMRQKQQEAEAELEELRRKRDERRKVLEEEERQKKQEEAERRAKEEEEKRRMKEEIERRRAQAAERRQKVGDEVDGEASKPFKCVSPRGSSLKIGERAEFLNKSAQKSTVKTSHSPVVSKIDNRLEQYTTAVQSNKEVRSPRTATVDLPVASDGVRNIKTMWEKGSVFGSGTNTPSSNKDAAGIKVGVAGRINDWLNKTPESSKTPGGIPADLKRGDVTGKRSLWENKGSPATKVTSRGESKSVANGMGH
ncbi:caldesmon 1a isoform X2 [Electrophorus electricus]|uniref:caldesmon 1a isoform X2 n=1 Tax=Electrophorus electricus TaxID=8005 RepID=UPI0015CF9C69|nr:caldesmon 1a isoform X2 [Electrophorus electricus]